MKPDFMSISSALILLLLMQMPHFATADISGIQLISETPVNCESAIRMNCHTDSLLTSEFQYGNYDPLISQESCIGVEDTMSEYWLSLSLAGANMYYLDGYGVNAGMEVYTGSCDSLVMVDCEPALGDDSFIGFFPPVSDHYYIRLLGYKSAGDNRFEIVLNCGVPGPGCTISIDSVGVGACVSDSGTVSIFMSGSVNPEPYLPLIYAEVVTDMGYYAFSGEGVDGLWYASLEVSGSVVNYVAVFIGNSENGCGDSRTGMVLPTVLCNTAIVPSFIGSIDWNINCGRRSGEVKLYEPGTDIQVQSYLIDIYDTGSFEIENLPSGTYDLILNVYGYLPKGFSNVEISGSNSLFYCGSLIHGDLNGNGYVDVLDVSLIVSLFNTTLPADNSLGYVDQNCDGVIDILDISAIIDSFGEIGDTVPLGN